MNQFFTQENALKLENNKNNKYFNMRNKMKKVDKEVEVRGGEYPSWSSGSRSDSLTGSFSFSLGSSSQVSQCSLKKFNHKTYLNAFLCGQKDVMEADSGL